MARTAIPQTVLVVQPLHADGLTMLDDRDHVSYHVLPTADRDAMLRLAPEIDAITIRDGQLPADVIERAPRLRVVSRHGVGYDNVPVEVCTARGIPVTIVGDVNTNAVVEHTMFLLLAAARAGVALDRAVRVGDFAIRSRSTAVELRGRTLLVVGLGRVGRGVAARAQSFGMRVVGYDPLLAGNPPVGVELLDRFERALPTADAVSLHVPLTDRTRHLLDRAALAMLPDGAIVVNTARGGLIDERALVDAVGSGRLHGAALDVFADEPLPATSALVAETRIVLSPHAAALTDESLRSMSAITVRNVFDAFDGRLDPALVVNPEVIGAPPIDDDGRP